MADIHFLVPKILKWEGGKVDDPLDHGGATNKGVTIATWQAVGYDKDGDGDIDKQDLFAITADDFTLVLKKYWDRWQADRIQNQSIAELLVDFVWGSGKWGIKIPQRILGLVDDGVVGSKTILAVNSANQQELFNKLYEARVHFLQDIVVHHPDQQRFIHGWMNRLQDFGTFKS